MTNQRPCCRQQVARLGIELSETEDQLVTLVCTMSLGPTWTLENSDRTSNCEAKHIDTGRIGDMTPDVNPNSVKMWGPHKFSYVNVYKYLPCFFELSVTTAHSFVVFVMP